MLSFNGMIESLVLYNYIGFLALLLALYYYISARRTFPFIIPFLLLSNFVEIGLIYYFGLVGKNNIIAYNYFNIVCILYYFYLYYKYFENKEWSKYILLVAFIWSAYAAYLVFFIDPFLYFYNSYVIGLIIISTLIILFLKDIIERKEFISVKKIPLFYFSMGIIFFAFSSLPILIFSEDLLFGTKNNIMNLLIQLGNIFLNVGYLMTVVSAGRNDKKI